MYTLPTWQNLNVFPGIDPGSQGYKKRVQPLDDMGSSTTTEFVIRTQGTKGHFLWEWRWVGSLSAMVLGFITTRMLPTPCLPACGLAPIHIYIIIKIHSTWQFPMGKLHLQSATCGSNLAMFGLQSVSGNSRLRLVSSKCDFSFILFRFDSQSRIGHRPNLPASQKLQSTFELLQQRVISALVSPPARGSLRAVPYPPHHHPPPTLSGTYSVTSNLWPRKRRPL